jgi:hypothetical protein
MIAYKALVTLKGLGWKTLLLYATLSNAVFRSLTTIKSWEWLSDKGEAQKDKESRLEL